LSDTTQNSAKSVVLAAGGTGGHLFPAYALAQELGRRGLAVDLVTDHRVDKYGTDFPGRQIYQVPSATLASKSPIAFAKTSVTLGRGFLVARKLLRKLRPAGVVGFGGYPTLPPLFAASSLGIPTVLHEQNAVLGRANRLLARRVTAIATSFDKVKSLDTTISGKVRLTGNPVRDAVIQASLRPYDTPRLDGPFSLLVFGGSQGARYFSDAVPPALIALPAAVRGRLSVVQQAREEDLDRVRKSYAKAGIRAEVQAFFKNLPEIMSASHLVIARAGASTVAELSVIGRPAILVPLPHALDNDQLQNATRLAESGGAWCIEQKALTTVRLGGEIARLAADSTALTRAAAAAKKQGRPDAVKRLAGLVEDLILGRTI
jgi:UDP-N-acetylglucosamine--N-acetylmuramyl-(pentapeptide) pyrophosphoryl-undecaprenol N-acetylglucosamine transferase